MATMIPKNSDTVESTTAGFVGVTPVLNPQNLETTIPSAADVLLAREACSRLAAREFSRNSIISIQLLDDGDQAETITVPTSAVRLFQQLLTEMSQGHAIAIMSTDAELTTQQAADLLHVSQSYLVGLLDEGTLPCRRAGKDQYVRLDDLMTFKRNDDEAKAKIQDQLTAEAQELGMGY